jgi:hypothetical protein
MKKTLNFWEISILCSIGIGCMFFISIIAIYKTGFEPIHEAHFLKFIVHFFTGIVAVQFLMFVTYGLLKHYLINKNKSL